MKTRILFALATTICFAGTFAVAQTAPAAQSKSKSAAGKISSQVDQVILLVKAGMSESLIIKTLQKSAKPVDLTTADLVKLKEAGVSENIMTVMMDPAANLNAPPAPPPAPVAAPPVAAPAPQPPPPPPAPVSAPPAPAPPAPATARVRPTTGDWRAEIQQRIESDYPLTQPTGDKTDIVSAGSVIVLKKNSLVFHTEGTLSNANTYKGGKLSAGFFGGICKNAQDGTCRVFVRGEKFWLIGVDVKDDGLVLQFLSDALPDSRYSGSVKFPFAKGTQHTADEMAGVVAEVIGVDPSSAQQAAAPAPAAAPPAPPPQQRALAPIAPPPPPPDQPVAPPPTLALGQSKDQVVAAMGQPERIANLGPKQILYFKNLKVTLVNNKVTDIQ